MHAVTRNASIVALRVSPDWDGVAPLLARDAGELLHEVSVWSSTLSKLLAQMEKLQVALDLEDLSRTI